MPFYNDFQSKTLTDIFLTQNTFRSLEFGLLFDSPQMTGGSLNPKLITNEITQPEYKRLPISLDIRNNQFRQNKVNNFLNIYQSHTFVTYIADIQFATALRGWGFVTSLGCWGVTVDIKRRQTIKTFIWWVDFQASINLQIGQAIFIPKGQIKIGWNA